MKCYNDKCLYNIRADYKCGFYSPVIEIHITESGKCSELKEEQK